MPPADFVACRAEMREGGMTRSRFAMKPDENWLASLRFCRPVRLEAHHCPFSKETDN
jgi:hypothetical protein